MPDDDSNTTRPRPFWSGAIAFGLVNIPVSLVAAHRANRVALRMTDGDGTPLNLRYFCPRHEQPLSADTIVRGYEVEKNSFVIIEDDELDSVAPEKSSEIDLRQFVPETDIDPIYIDRTYFLLPEKSAVKAYRLLAKSMQDKRRAGIATFVMRSTEYLVALVATDGVLRAETLRFDDELRRPGDIGLPAMERGDPTRVERITKSINSHSRETLDSAQLSDRHSEAVCACIDKKLKSNEDVIKNAAAEEEGQDGYNVIDLMPVLKQRLEQTEDEKPNNGTQSRSAEKTTRNSKNGNSTNTTSSSLDKMSKHELYGLAQDIDVAGRSKMSRANLIEAINAHN